MRCCFGGWQLSLKYLIRHVVFRLGVVAQRPARVDDVHGDADRDGHGRPLEARD